MLYRNNVIYIGNKEDYMLDVINYKYVSICYTNLNQD